jgi:hypothetical protein
MRNNSAWQGFKKKVWFVYVRVCVCVCACVRACVRACMCCVCARERLRVNLCVYFLFACAFCVVTRWHVRSSCVCPIRANTASYAHTRKLIAHRGGDISYSSQYEGWLFGCETWCWYREPHILILWCCPGPCVETRHETYEYESEEVKSASSTRSAARALARSRWPALLQRQSDATPLLSHERMDVSTCWQRYPGLKGIRQCRSMCNLPQPVDDGQRASTNHRCVEHCPWNCHHIFRRRWSQRHRRGRENTAHVMKIMMILTT